MDSLRALSIEANASPVAGFAELKAVEPVASTRLGAVIVASHNPQWVAGQVLDVTLPAEK